MSHVNVKDNYFSTTRLTSFQISLTTIFEIKSTLILCSYTQRVVYIISSEEERRSNVPSSEGSQCPTQHMRAQREGTRGSHPLPSAWIFGGYIFPKSLYVEKKHVHTKQNDILNAESDSTRLHRDWQPGQGSQDGGD